MSRLFHDHKHETVASASSCLFLMAELILKFGLYYKLIYICIVITGGNCPYPSGRVRTGSEKLNC